MGKKKKKTVLYKHKYYTAPRKGQVMLLTAILRNLYHTKQDKLEGNGQIPDYLTHLWLMNR